MKLSVIILAAGNSKRFGKENKLLYRLNGKLLIEYSLLLALNLQKKLIDIIDEVIVVSKYEEIKQLTLQYGFNYVLNLASDEGISTSIKLGITHAKEENAYLFLVGDEPYLKFTTILNYIKSFLESKKGIASLIDINKNPGNPCIFSFKYKQDLLQLQNDTGGRKIINKNLDDVFFFEVSSQEIIDIDTKTSN